MKTRETYQTPTIQTFDAKTVVEALGPVQGYGPPAWANPGGQSSSSNGNHG